VFLKTLIFPNTALPLQHFDLPQHGFAFTYLKNQMARHSQVKPPDEIDRRYAQIRRPLQR
jgi:hypothetical protein